MFDANQEAIALIDSWRRAPMFDTELRESLVAALRAAERAGMLRAAQIAEKRASQWGAIIELPHHDMADWRYNEACDIGGLIRFAIRELPAATPAPAGDD